MSGCGFLSPSSLMVLPQKPFPGRPRKTTLGTDKLLKHELMKNPWLTGGLSKKSHPKLLENVSVETIQQRLQKELNLPTFRPAQKLLLTKVMVKKRLAFACKYKNYTEEQWSRVIFSDESTSKCIRSWPGWIIGSWNSDRYAPLYTGKPIKHLDSVIVWRAFSVSGGLAGLYFFLPKNQTKPTNDYIQVFFHDFHSCHTFMEDSAPCHNAKKKRWSGWKNMTYSFLVGQETHRT